MTEAIDGLERSVARTVIEVVGQSGIPPEFGYEYFTCGIDDYLKTIDDDYLSDFVKDGGGAFKMVVGVYGGGKTHFLYAVRGLAWKRGFATSYVSLSPGESPFHKLELVYGAIIRGLVPPPKPGALPSGAHYDRGVINLVRFWVMKRQEEYARSGLAEDEINDQMLGDLESMQGIESLSFKRAMIEAFKAVCHGDSEKLELLAQWISGEGYDSKHHKPLGILHKIDKAHAPTMIRSLIQWLREIGLSGLVVLLDEAERVPSLSTKQRDVHLGNLRELIDGCARSDFSGSMFFYAVPDEGFLEGNSQVYEALRQRLGTIFNEFNPSGVKIELEHISGDPVEMLVSIGLRLGKVFEVAFECDLKLGEREYFITDVASKVYDLRYGDTGYKRIFVQKLVMAFQYLRKKEVVPSLEVLGLE